MHHLTHTRHSGNREALLVARARQLRGALNLPQQKLWNAVAGGRLGVHFRREVPLLGRYIVDMLAPSIRLVVEIDGRCHERKRGADARRDNALVRAGYHVLRLKAALVLHEPAAAVARILEVVRHLRTNSSA